MELLRVAPFPLTLTYSDFPNSTAVVATFATNRNDWLDDIEVTTSGTGVASFTLPERYSRYDGEYSLVVYEGTSANKGDVLLLDTVRVVRPYVDSAALSPVGKEDEYAKFERIARIMIDNVVGGFYYQNSRFDLQGTGTDKLVIGQRVNKLLSVIENNAILYELDGTNNAAEFTMNSDKTAIVAFRDGEEDNLIDGYPVRGTSAATDYYENDIRVAVFPNGYNYTVSVENGWPMVPQDIKEATELIIEDMACGAPNYWSKYVRMYETKDFKVDFQRSMFAGTGNVIVDQILHRYLGDTLYNNIRVL